MNIDAYKITHPRTGVVMQLHPSVAVASHWIDEQNLDDSDTEWDLAHFDVQGFVQLLRTELSVGLSSVYHEATG